MIIEKSKKFAKNLINHQIVFVLICANVVESTTNEFNASIISNEFKKYVEQFDNEKIEMLFDQKNNNHAIDLIKNQKFSFMILYNFFQKKLTKLR